MHAYFCINTFAGETAVKKYVHVCNEGKPVFSNKAAVDCHLFLSHCIFSHLILSRDKPFPGFISKKQQETSFPAATPPPRG